MDSGFFLSDSHYCRLCGEENVKGTDIYATEENQLSIQELINKYLPLKVEIEDKFPKLICPGCHIQLEATKLFMDLIIDGQAKLRQILHDEQDKLNRQEKQRLQLEQVLQNVNPKSSVETYTIESDDSGEKYVIQIISDGPLFPPDHELALKVEGLSKPKRKRGRPPKPPPGEVIQPEIKEEEVVIKQEVQEDEEEEIGPDGRRKRKIKAPSRFQEVVQGKELDKFFIEEGVIDDDEAQVSNSEGGVENNSADTAVGRVENVDGETTGLVFANKNKVRHGPGILRRKKKFSCEICSKDFHHFGRFQVHRKSHNIHYMCSAGGCGEVRKHKEEMLQHQNETGHTGYNPFEKISTIKDTVLSATDITEPLVEITEILPNETPTQEAPSKEFRCQQCNKTFTCKQNLEVHIKAQHTNEKQYECDECGLRFSYPQSLKLHKHKHTNRAAKEAKRFACDSCDKVFTHPSSLLYHKNTEHNNGKRFVCNKCDKSFKHKQLLQRHQLVHSNDRPFKCTVCRVGFKTKTGLLNHEVIHTGEKKYACNQCGNSFSHKTSLILHQRWHDGHKPFKCDVCDKMFGQKGNLREHMRIHTGEKPYYCEQCGNSFTTSSQYKLHCKKHSGERPYRCEACHKTFLHKTSWLVHSRRHSNERPYKCRFCDKGFLETWALKKHERLHTGEKPYKCDKCDKTFSDGSNMIKHRRTHDTDSKHMTLQVINSLPQTVLVADNEMTIERRQGINLADAFGTAQINEQGQLLLGEDSAQGISIVQDENSVEHSVRGLLPDGTIVPLDWSQIQNNKDLFQIQGVDIGDTGLLDTGVQFMAGTEDVKSVDSMGTNLRFINEDGQEMCFVTTYAVDDNSINPQILMSKDGLINMKLA